VWSSSEFDEFVRLRADELQRAAFLLTNDWALAQDLVQTALVKTWLKWASIRSLAAVPAYVHRTLITTFLSWRRRAWLDEWPRADMTEIPERHAGEAIELRQSVIAALRILPPRQRAVIVLRYFLDMTEVDTAAAMGCSVGTVKTHHSRAVAKLRSAPALSDMHFRSETR
jgi:RNA polymerase sigma-70 factor (sigma-E family)